VASTRGGVQADFDSGRLRHVSSLLIAGRYQNGTSREFV
jgi:hypothetical protein